MGILLLWVLLARRKTRDRDRLYGITIWDAYYECCLGLDLPMKRVVSVVDDAS